MRLLAALALCSTLAACAVQRGPVSPQEIAAREAVFTCYRRAANALDDGVSDARSVSRTVQSRCWNEEQLLVQLATAGTCCAYRAGMVDGLTDLFREEAATVVLEARASRRTAR